MRLGIEVELTGGAHDAISVLCDEGLAAAGHLHDYHCNCDCCEYDRPAQYAWTGQEDCTVDGELISRILTWGDDAWQAIAKLGNVLHEVRAEADPFGGGNYDAAGNHVHVENVLDANGRRRLYRLFLRYGQEGGDLELLASAASRDMRGYNSRVEPEHLNPRVWRRNSPPDAAVATAEWVHAHRDGWEATRPANWHKHDAYHGTEGWLRCNAHRRTIEFRLWNATTLAWRLHMHAGLSVAMVKFADDPHSPVVTARTARPLLALLDPYMDADTARYAQRQMAYATAA